MSLDERAWMRYTYRRGPLAQTKESHLNYQWTVEVLSVFIKMQAIHGPKSTHKRENV